MEPHWQTRGMGVVTEGMGIPDTDTLDMGMLELVYILAYLMVIHIIHHIITTHTTILLS